PTPMCSRAVESVTVFLYLFPADVVDRSEAKSKLVRLPPNVPGAKLRSRKRPSASAACWAAFYGSSKPEGGFVGVLSSRNVRRGEWGCSGVWAAASNEVRAEEPWRSSIDTASFAAEA